MPFFHRRQLVAIFICLETNDEVEICNLNKDYFSIYGLNLKSDILHDHYKVEICNLKILLHLWIDIEVGHFVPWEFTVIFMCLARSCDQY